MNVKTVELVDSPGIGVDNYLGENSEPMNLGAEATQAIYEDAWAQLEGYLVAANERFNDASGDPFDRASELQNSLEKAYRCASVIRTLTAIPLAEETPES